jgi:hypothetical protein
VLVEWISCKLIVLIFGDLTFFVLEKKNKIGKGKGNPNLNNHRYRASFLPGCHS